MKQFLTILMMIAVCAVHAAAQYKAILQNSGVGIQMLGNESISLKFIRNDGSAADYSGGNPSNYQSFGYTVTDADGNVSSVALDLTTMQNGVVFLGDFQAGDQVSFWASNGQGGFFDSMHEDGEKGTSRDSAYIGNNNNVIVATMGDVSAKGWGPVKMDSINDNTNFNFIIGSSSELGGGGGGKPSGQPLPGVVAGLLIGASLFGAKRLKKKFSAK